MKPFFIFLTLLLLSLAPAWAAQAVGYYNQTLLPGLNALAPQLASDERDTVGEQFGDLPDGSIVYQMVNGNFTTNTFLGGMWERPDEPLEIGRGVLVFNPLDRNTTVTFVGQLLQGTLTNEIPAGLSLKGNMITKQGGLGSALGLSLNDFDTVYLLRNGAWDVYTQLPGGTWHPSEPAVQVGDAFMVRASSATNHVIHFSVDPFPAQFLATAAFRPHAVPALGTVNFANAAAGLLARVISGANGAGVEGSAWRVQLLHGSGDEFETIAETSFLTGQMAGYFFGGRVDVPGTAPGESAVLKVRILRDSHAVAESEPLTVELGGGILPPSNLAGLPVLRAIEPMRLFVQRDEGQTTVSWSSEIGGAQLEISDAIGGEWRPYDGTESSNESLKIATIAAEGPARFFRLRMR